MKNSSLRSSLIFGLLAAVAMSFGCAESGAPARVHEVVDELGNPLGRTRNPYDTFEWQKKGPMEFLTYLRSVRGYAVDGIHRNWVQAGDLPQLIALLDSQDPCGSVAMTISSYHESQLSTVGQEAAFLIEGFRRGRYPPALNSTRPLVDKSETREWWESFKQSRGET